MAQRFVRVKHIFEGRVVGEDDATITIIRRGEGTFTPQRTFPKNEIEIEELALGPEPAWWPPQRRDLIAVVSVGSTEVAPEVEDYIVITAGGPVSAANGAYTTEQIRQLAREDRLRLVWRRTAVQPPTNRAADGAPSES